MSIGYWDQVQKQVTDITSRLGSIKRIFHELISEAGPAGAEAIKQLNPGGYAVIEAALAQGADVVSLEDADNLTEFMDWSRCLYIGLQNPGVQKQVLEAYTAAAEKRKKHLAEVIDTTLGQDEIGLLVLREEYQVSFPTDIQVFYVAPPALDEIKRWVRQQESAAEKNGDAS